MASFSQQREASYEVEKQRLLELRAAQRKKTTPLTPPAPTKAPESDSREEKVLAAIEACAVFGKTRGLRRVAEVELAQLIDNVERHFHDYVSTTEWILEDQKRRATTEADHRIRSVRDEHDAALAVADARCAQCVAHGALAASLENDTARNDKNLASRRIEDLTRRMDDLDAETRRRIEASDAEARAQQDFIAHLEAENTRLKAENRRLATEARISKSREDAALLDKAASDRARQVDADAFHKDKATWQTNLDAELAHLDAKVRKLLGNRDDTIASLEADLRRSQQDRDRLAALFNDLESTVVNGGPPPL